MKDSHAIVVLSADVIFNCPAISCYDNYVAVAWRPTGVTSEMDSYRIPALQPGNSFDYISASMYVSRPLDTRGEARASTTRHGRADRRPARILVTA